MKTTIETAANMIVENYIAVMTGDICMDDFANANGRICQSLGKANYELAMVQAYDTLKAQNRL